MKIIFILTVGVTATASIAAPIIPMAPGTARRYNMTQEADHGLNVPTPDQILTVKFADGRLSH